MDVQPTLSTQLEEKGGLQYSLDTGVWWAKATIGRVEAVVLVDSGAAGSEHLSSAIRSPLHPIRK